MSEEPIAIMGFQDSFRSSVRSTTEAVLRRLGAEVRPNHVLLVATPREGDGPSYVVPQPMSDAVDLGDLHAEVQELIEEHPEAGVFDSHPHMADLRQRRIRREAVAAAIAGRLGATGALHGHPEAVTVEREGHHFTVCLLLPQALDEIITPLPPFTWGTVPATASLLTAGLEEIKGRVAYDLQMPEPGPRDLSLSAEEISERAASRFFRDALYRAGSFLELDFETVDQVAATTYEKGAAEGLMVVSPEGHEAVELVVKLSTHVNSRQVRQVRKLLETSSAGHALLVSDGSVIGMGTLDRSADISDVMEIHITGHDRWELHHEGIPLMVVNRGVARVPQPTFDVARLRDHAPRVLGEDVNDRQLLELVSAAATLGHGSTIVMSRDAEQEADRLGGQAFSVAPDELTVERLEALSHVDGAFLLDAQCVMHAFGVILDGSAQAYGGDSGRGSRYNSAARYVDSVGGGRALAIVTSDDGGVDLFPNLPLRVPRAHVEDTVIMLEQSAGDPDRIEAFLDAERRLRSLRHHLTPEQAHRANAAFAKENESRAAGGFTVFPVWPRFESDEPPPDDYFSD